MAVIDTINVGGADYRIQDAEARSNATSALNRASNKMGIYTASTDMEHGVTFSKARPKGSCFTWTGYSDPNVSPASCITLKAVTAGEAIRFGDTCNLLPIVDNLVYAQNVYVGSDSKLHYRNVAGADTALNFSGKKPQGFHLHLDCSSGESDGEHILYIADNYWTTLLITQILVGRDARDRIRPEYTFIEGRDVNSNGTRLWTYNKDASGYTDEQISGLWYRIWRNPLTVTNVNRFNHIYINFRAFGYATDPFAQINIDGYLMS